MSEGNIKHVRAYWSEENVSDLMKIISELGNFSLVFLLNIIC